MVLKRRFHLLGACCTLSLLPLSAADRIWDGLGPDNFWSTALNWGGVAPVPGDSLFFGGIARLAPVNDFAADSSFAGITFDAGAGGFTLSGNRMTLGGDIANLSANLQTITLAMILDATRGIDTGASGLTLGGVLSGPGGITKSGAGTLLFSGSGSNLFSGLTEVTAGQVTLGKTGGATAVSGDLTLSGAGTALVFAAGGSQNQIANTATVTLNGSGSVLGQTAANFGALVGASQNVTEEIARLIVNDGIFYSGTGAWTISDSGTFNGTSGDARYLQNSSGSVSFGSLSLTGMTGTSAASGADSFVVLGNNAIQSSLTVGSGGLMLDGSRLILSFGSGAGVSGSRLVLNGNVSTAGTTASFIQSSTTLGSVGTTLVHLSGLAGDHVRTFTVSGGGADLTVSAAIENGAATNGGILKTGAGTLFLTGSAANTYTGLTSVGQGVLNLGKSGGVNAIGGNLAISGTGGLRFAGSGAQDQIPDTAGVVVTGGAFNGTGPNVNSAAPIETIGSLTVTNGSFNTGSGSVWTVAGAGVFDGTGAGDVRFIGNSGSIIQFGSLSLTAMTGTTIVSSADGFVMGGANGSIVSTIRVGAGGLFLNGSVVGINRGGTGQLGSRLVLDGDVTTSGTTASTIASNSGSVGQGDLELSSTAGDVVRTFNIAGGGANLTVTVPMTNGAATSAGILKTGAGTLTLSGPNTYSGGTTVNEGVLAIGAAERLLDSGTLTIGGSGTFSLGANRNETVGDVHLTATSGGISGSGSSTLTSSAVSADIASGLVTIDVALSGSATFEKSGDGTLVLSGGAANTFSGLTTVSGGLLRLGKTGGVNALGGDLTITGNGDVVFAAGGAQDQIPDGATVIVNGTGGLGGSTFNGTEANNGWQSSLTETIGSLVVSNGNFNTGPAANWTITGAASFNGTGTADTRFVGNSGSTTYFGSLGLTAMTGTSIVSSADSFVLGGANATTVSTIRVGSGGITLDGSVVGLNRGGSGSEQGSRLILDGNLSTAGSSGSSILNPAGGFNKGDVELSSSAGHHVRTFDVGGGGADLAISARITNGAADSGGILKTGQGILVLSGANTYTGPTSVSQGTLIVNGDQSAATGAITVSSGAILGGDGVLGGDVSVAGALRIGGDSLAGTTGSLDFGGNDLAFSSGSTWFIDIVAGAVDMATGIDQLTIGPGSTLSFAFLAPTETSYTIATYASRFDSTTFSGFDEGAIISGYQISYGANAITLTAIPEPGTLAILGAGLATFLLRRRRGFRCRFHRAGR